MIQKIKNSILVLAMLALPGLTMIAPVAVYAATIQDSICEGVGKAAGDGGTDCTKTSTSAEGLYTLAAKVVNVFSIIVGIIAVIMIIFGGFKYITSGGDSGNVSGAKNTLIYAIVGLIIVALAQFIVRFVLNTTYDATTTTG